MKNKNANIKFDSSHVEKILKENSTLVERKLQEYLDQSNFGILYEPMSYSLLNGGKRLRPLLCIESSKIFNINPEKSIYPAMAIECMHSYSLVHDDLPAMDNDDLRRGKPTIHKKWDEATAILIGDALQSLSFEILSDKKMNVDSTIRNQLVFCLAKNAGASGMVLGQALDIKAESSKKRISVEEIENLQSYKTGKLISWSCEVGAILSNEDTSPFKTYALCIGLAFQIQDDILDVTGSSKILGKKAGKDHHKNKATYVSSLGIDGARRKNKMLIEEACDSLSFFGKKGENLCNIAHFIINRKN
tara:strand:+ start:1662 stop:2573 length:912 start_codon:yes stop_codon:yes gene_type:complete